MTTRYQIIQEGGVWDFQTRTRIPADRSNADWQAYLAWLTAGGVPLPADSTGQMELEEAKKSKVEEIDAYAAGLRNQIVQGRSAGEMASWTLKLLDGMASSAGQSSPFAPILVSLQTILNLPKTPKSYNDTIAMVRGISEQEHINKVLTQAVPYLAAEAAIDGIRGKHADYINNCTTIEEIIMYNWKLGWPSL